MRRLLMAIVLSVVASPVAAQPAPWQPERFTAGWVFTPSIVFGGMWDSNVTLRNDPTGANPEVAEWVGIVNPRGEIDFNGQRAKFTAGYSGRLEAYRELDELTRYDQRGRVEARYQMTRRLLFQSSHQLTMVPTTEELETLSGIPFTRVGSRMVTSGGGFTAGLTRRMKLSTAYLFQWVDFERDPRFARLEGGHQHSPSAELKYAVSRRLDVGGTWVYHHAVIDGAEEIFDTQQVGGIAEFTVNRSVKVRGMGGVAYLRMASTGETRRGPSYGAAVAYNLPQVSIDAGYQRSFVPSFGFGGMTASQDMHVRANVPLARGRMFVSGGFLYRRNEPVLSTSFPIALTVYRTQAAFGYAVARWLRMETFVNVAHQTSSAQGNIDRTRVGVQFVTFKPVRIQ